MRHAMLAGSYQGSLGRYHQNTISAQGAGMRTAALHSALGRTGISGLGDLCQDGWGAFFSAAIGAAGGAVSAYGSGQRNAEGQVQADRGFVAVGDGMSQFSTSFESACTARRQNQANASNTAGFEQQFGGGGGGGGSATPPPPPAESKGIDTTTLIIIGAVALGAVVLLRK